MTPSEKFLSKIGLREKPTEPSNKVNDAENSRRNFLKKSTLGGLALGGFLFASLEDTLAHSTSRVNRYSAPSDLKITDMRYATVMNTTHPVINYWEENIVTRFVYMPIRLKKKTRINLLQN